MILTPTTSHRVPYRFCALLLVSLSLSGMVRAENPVRQAIKARTALEEASSIKDVTDSVDATIPATPSETPPPPSLAVPVVAEPVSEPVTESATQPVAEPLTAEPVPVDAAGSETEGPVLPPDSGDGLMPVSSSPVESTVAAEPQVAQVEVTPFRDATGAVTNAEDMRITISLDDVSLEDTVRMFAQTSGANIISAPNLYTGKYVSVNLVDVDWLPALRSILEIHNFTLTERTPGSGVFSVQVRAADAPEPSHIKTFPLKYTTSGEMIKPVEQMLSPKRADIKALQFGARNSLVVRTTENNIGELDKLIAELDRPANQILIEVKILELNDSAAKEVGVKWDFLRSVNIGSFGARYSREYSETSGFEYDRGHVAERADSTVAQNNSAYTAATSSDNLSPIPLSTFNNSVTATRQASSSAGTSQQAVYNDGYNVIKNIISGNSLNFILDPEVFSLFISALEDTDGVSLVSNPKIITTSGKTDTFINIGVREPILRRTIINPGESNAYVTVELDSSLDTGVNEKYTSLPVIRRGYLEAGLNLTLSSTVKDNDFIEAFINPQLTRIVDYKTAVVMGEIIDWPVIDVKELGTTFTLKSGQTVAIGGLTQTGDRKEQTRVPFLGQIPVLGRLFSHKKSMDDKTETVIFVTLTTVDPANFKPHDAIPEDARLVFRRMLSDKSKMEEFKKELAALEQGLSGEESSDEEEQPTAKKIRKKR